MSDPTPSVSSYKQDEDYYFEDVYFLIETTMFKVPKHHFQQESPVFRDMFRLPVAVDTVAEGTTKEKPLRLDGIKANDFRQLVRALYPRHYQREGLTLVEWEAVLKLATMWDFVSLRSTAISKLDEWTIEGPKLLALARDYEVAEWWLPALQRIADHPPLTDDEVQQLGVPLSIKIASLQGRLIGFRERPNPNRSASPPISAPLASPRGPKRASKTQAPVIDAESTYVDECIKRLFPDVDIDPILPPFGFPHHWRPEPDGKVLVFS